MKIALFVLISFFTLSLNAQQYKGYKKAKAKKSYASGTMFFYWGYNRSLYTKSDMHFIGPGYDFTLGDCKAADRPSKELKTYFDPKNITVPQFNLRIGYNFKNHWGISVGYDHMKYVLKENQPYTLTGHINPGYDNVTHWSGDYNGDTVYTQTETFHYENTNGLNYIRMELTRFDQWYRNKSGNFAITSSIGGSLGGILSFNDFTFAGRKDVATISMSGFGLSAHVGARFEFFKHIFLQLNATGGFMSQQRVMNRPHDYNSYTKQNFGFTSREAVIGALFYIRPKNDCNSCPHW